MPGGRGGQHNCRGWPWGRLTDDLAPLSPVQRGFDVFNALDLMENKTFLEKLKFGIGDGNLQYYLYNWKCPSMGAEKVSSLLSTGVALVGAGQGAVRVGYLVWSLE